MSLLERIQQFARHHSESENDFMAPLGTVIEHLYSATEGSINGRRTILVGTNNYLGLTFDNRCINAAIQAIRNYGTGTTGSRLANGSYAGHQALERDLANFYGVQHCIVFSTGYTANLGMITSLVGRGDTILIDEHCHASIYDGCKQSGADIIHFRHNNAQDLGKRLRRLGDKAASSLIIVEGIYSMLGDRCKLEEIIRVKQEYDALILIDEAHSLGVLGQTGRGLAQQVQVESQVDFITGTFSKSLAGIGGYCVSQHAELDVLRYLSRPYIFTASPSPATIASTRAALDIIQTTPSLREQLWANAHYLYDGLTSLGYELSPEVSPVIAINVGLPENALTLWKKLFDRGIYVNLVMPPATPNSRCLLRCSVSAAHTNAQLGVVLDAFAHLHSPQISEQMA